jgi:hypothetical protein
MSTAAPFATTPITRDVWAPHITRENKSRPSRSVPNQYLVLGGVGAPSSVSPSKKVSSGENGAIQEAPAANITRTPTTSKDKTEVQRICLDTNQKSRQLDVLSAAREFVE